MKRFLEEHTLPIIVILGTVFVVAVLFWRTEKTIVIDDRYWVYDVTVGHYETNYDYVCTGVHPDQTCSMQSSRDWVTTCRASSAGYALPPTEPLYICRDGIVKTNITYWVKYHVADEQKQSLGKFRSAHWTDFSVGSILTVNLDAFDNITKVIEKVR